MSYYANELAKINPSLTKYPPVLKIYANGNGEDTNGLTINQESASEAIFWLANNFLNDKSLDNCLQKLKQLKTQSV